MQVIFGGHGMAQLHFTRQLARFLAAPSVMVDAADLRSALEAAFAQQPLLRGYVVDEQGRLRQHVAVFIDGLRCRDRLLLGDPLRPDSEVHVLQALSGG